MKHENGVERCSRCENKLFTAHPTLVSWFYWVKSNHPDCHIAWSFRDEKSQHQAFESGKSKLDWPFSKHNCLDAIGNPQSKALDLFSLNDEGGAEFKKEYFEQIWHETQASNLPMKWGGNFKSLGDNDHFEIKEDSNG